MAILVEIKQQRTWNDGRTSVVYSLTDDSTGIRKESEPSPNGILPAGVDPLTYGNENASTLYENGRDLNQAEQSEAARLTLSNGAITSKLSIPLILAFNKAASDLRAQAIASEPDLDDFDPDAFCDDVYDVWRIIFDSLSYTMKMNFMTYQAIHDPRYKFYPEPLIVTSDYKAWFNRGISGTLGYMTDLAQM